MPKSKSSTSQYGDPPADQPSIDNAVATLADVDKAIVAHQALLREIPFRVLQPLAQQALQRIRTKAAELAIPETAVPAAISRSTLGQVVTHTETGEIGIVLASSLESRSPEEIYHTILTQTGRIITVPARETQAGSTPGPQGTPATQAPVTTESTPVTAPTAPLTPHQFHPGDPVSTPVANGRITSLLTEVPEVWTVTLDNGVVMHFPTSVLSIRVP